jgi:hypothetical protein
MTDVAEAPGAARRERAAVTLLLDGAGLLLVLPLWFWWAVWRGAFPTTVWAPGLVYLACVAIVLAFALPTRPVRGVRAVALAAIVLLAAFAALSMLWSANPGGAWLGAERLALYALSLALPLLWPPSRRALLIALAALPVAALLGGVAAIAGGLATPGSFTQGRLVAPAGYPNASAALFLMGAFPAIVLASRRERVPWLRVAMLSCAATLLAFALLTQSRGAVGAAAVTAVVVLAATPGRLRLLLPLVLSVVPVAVLTGTLLDVRSTAQAGDPTGALHDASAALVAIAAVAALIGAAYVLADQRVQPAADAVRAMSRAAAALLAVVVVAGAVGFVATQGSPFSWAQDRWHDFKTPDYVRVEDSSNRFAGGLGSNRYDYWRASVDMAADRPLGGEGAENFASAYLVRRTTLKAPIYSHSIWFSALSELGVPGLTLALTLVGALIAAVVAAARQADRRDRALVVAAALPGAYFLVHGSGDFLEAFPALVVPALGLAAAASAPAAPAPGRRRTGLVLGVAAALVGISVLPVLVNARLTAHASSSWAGEPSAALDDLVDAADIDPLDATAPVTRGVIALQLKRPADARQAFAQAADRDERGWFARFELGLITANAGDRAAAVRLLDEAARLNPREPHIPPARAAVLAGRPPDALLSAQKVIAEGG